MSLSREHQNQFVVSLELDLGVITLDVGEIQQLYFIEDIFSYSMVGKLRFIDARGIFEFGPITGNERVYISYGEEDEIEIDFKIYKVNRVDQMSTTHGPTQIIELLLAENLFFAMNFFYYSRAWKNKKISDIVNHICKHHLGNTNFDKWEDTIEELEYFYMPYWNINTTFKWLMKRGTGIESGEPGYCFFSNPKGGNFLTLEKMLMDSDMLDEVGQKPLYVFHSHRGSHYNKIINWSISGIDYSSVKQLSGGVLWGYNTEEKLFKKQEFGYKDAVSKQTILGQRTLFTDISEKRVMYKNLGETEDESLETLFHDNWNKRYVHQQCMSITCRGHEGRYCGGQIEIEWPSGNVNEQYNKNLKGKYLVKSITHTFDGNSNPQFSQKMILIKNGYYDSEINDLVNATKMEL